MPSRNQAFIRRGINRLNDLVEQEKSSYPVLAVVAGKVAVAAEKTNLTWREYQQAAISGDKERAERDTAIGRLETWIGNWRPVVLVHVPGASENIHNLPSSGATPDDIIRVGEDLKAFIGTNEGAAAFRDTALTDLGDKLEQAEKETAEAVSALPRERAARTAHTEACLEANDVLVRLLDMVRNLFGPTSAQYKQFIARQSSEEDDEIDKEVSIGEE